MSDTVVPQIADGEDSTAEPFDEAAEIARLAALSSFDYDRQRDAMAEQLGVRPTTLDKEVKRVRMGGGLGGQGQTIEFDQIEPWPTPVDGAGLLDEIASALRSCVYMDPWQHDIVALWVLHAHTLEAWEVTPRLGFSAPTLGCGKTQSLKFLKLVVPRPYMCVGVKEATLFRIIEKGQPTLLIDEFDNLSIEAKGPLLAVMNSGHQRGILVPRCVGNSHEVRGFATFTPVAYAIIGRPPGTLDSRTIQVELRRATYVEWSKLKPVAEIKGHLHTLARQAARWAKDNIATLQTAKPNMEPAVNRDADNWMPLFGIADVAGNGWGERAREAAKCVLAAGANRSHGEMVLVDIKLILDGSAADLFPSAELVKALVDLPGRPWAAYGRQQKPITQTALAALLAPFKITTEKVGPKHKRLNGYTRQQFEDAFKRYLPPRRPSDGTTGQHAIDAEQMASSEPDTRVRSESSQKSNGDQPVSGCPVADGECDDARRSAWWMTAPSRLLAWLGSRSRPSPIYGPGQSSPNGGG
jgi:putative DNA primase/helicase